VERFIAELNIQRFKALMAQERDVRQRDILLRLIADEEDELRLLSGEMPDAAKVQNAKGESTDRRLR